MEPLVLAIVIKLVPWIIVGSGALYLARSAFGRALLQRLQEGAVSRDDVLALGSELEDVRRELGEVQERLQHGL